MDLQRLRGGLREVLGDAEAAQRVADEPERDLVLLICKLRAISSP
jgi:hypothetical protein